MLSNFYMSWASIVGYVLLNIYKNHHTETLFIISISVYLSRISRDLFSIIIFIYIVTNYMISLKQSNTIFSQ